MEAFSLSPTFAAPSQVEPERPQATSPGGDFAAGQRAVPDRGGCGDVAAGVRVTPAPLPTGTFATGQRYDHAGGLTVGCFATGVCRPAAEGARASGVRSMPEARFERGLEDRGEAA
jgi:hypothetical protein